jgi:hypothetical protein
LAHTHACTSLCSHGGQNSCSIALTFGCRWLRGILKQWTSNDAMLRHSAHVSQQHLQHQAHGLTRWMLPHTPTVPQYVHDQEPAHTCTCISGPPTSRQHVALTLQLRTLSLPAYTMQIHEWGACTTVARVHAQSLVLQSPCLRAQEEGDICHADQVHTLPRLRPSLSSSCALNKLWGCTGEFSWSTNPSPLQ